jgi:sporulation-control protein spo0M
VNRQLLAVAAATLLLAGCGSGESADAPGTSSSGTVAPSEQLVVDVSIKGGKVTPTNEQLQAEVGEPIVLRVDSDATDELHVHSTPEHNFDVGIGPEQSFQFTVSVPGRVDIELHEHNATVATIQVR